MKPEFDLNRNRLEQLYLQAAARFHPDRFVNASARDQSRAMENSSLINQAYRVLRDPTTRAEYLVKLAGWDLDSNEQVGGAPCPDADFLCEMIERRDELPSDPMGKQGAVEQIEAECESYFDQAIAYLDRQDYYKAACTLIRHRYLRRLQQELET